MPDVAELADAITLQDALEAYGASQNEWGSTVFDETFSVAEDTTSIIVSYTPSSTEGVAGFLGNGESDGKYYLKINGNKKASSWANQASPNASALISNPIEVDSSDTIEIEVENIGDRSADYEGTLFIRSEL